MNVALSLPTLGIHDVAVVSVAGEEMLGAPHRFEVQVALSGLPLDGAAAVGAPAELRLGERVVGGVVTTLASSEIDGRAGFRATIAPRAWLLSLSRRSRTFEQLSTPEIVCAVFAASGLRIDVELRLTGHYPRRSLTVQHRESDLDFALRLLEREGITALIQDDGSQCLVVLADHNQSQAHQGPLSGVASLRQETRLLPHRVELFAVDPARPKLPLRASASVSESGIGDLEVHDEPFSTPEEGERAARLCAERLRCCGTVVEGSITSAIAPGRARIAERELLIVSARHTLSEGGWSSTFAAVPIELSFRPQRRAPEPKILGLSSGQIAPREPGATTLAAEGAGFRVRERAGDAADRGMPLAMDSGLELSEGAQVVWGCLDGDPERPVITALMPDLGGRVSTERMVMRTASGATIELAGALPPGFGVTQGSLGESSGRPRNVAVPAVAHHATLNTGSSNSVTDDNTTTDPTGQTVNAPDTYVRFAVPHSKGWSYVRIGDTAGDLTGLSESGKYSAIKRDGYADTLGLDWGSNGPGLFDYTDGSRTQITQGDWEEVVKGKGRLAVHGDNDDPVYEMVVTCLLYTSPSPRD